MWQLAWAFDLNPPIGLPSPLEIVLALWHLVASGELWFHLEVSVPRLVGGWVVGVTCGTAAWRLAHTGSKMRRLVGIVASNASFLPAIALLPLFIIWFGAGTLAMVATITLASLVAGTRAVRNHDDCPALVAGLRALRSSLPVALAVLVAVEMIGGGFGIGAFILSAAELYRSDQILAGCIVLLALGFGLDRLVIVVERRLAGGTSDPTRA